MTDIIVTNKLNEYNGRFIPASSDIVIDLQKAKIVSGLATVSFGLLAGIIYPFTIFHPSLCLPEPACFNIDYKNQEIAKFASAWWIFSCNSDKRFCFCISCILA